MATATILSPAYQELLKQLGELSAAAADLPPAAVAERLEQLACSIRAGLGSVQEAGTSTFPRPADGNVSGEGGGTAMDEGPSGQAKKSEEAEEAEDEGTAGAGDLVPNKKARKKERRATEKPQRQIDFTMYRQRYVALEVMYIGGAYSGFARQDNADNTIEAYLFSSMRQTKLIHETVDVSQLKYSRCGRTDKGVSALGQVVALMLRSCGKVDEDEVPEDREMDYPRILNRALPPEIRVLGWTTAPPDFNARFSAQYRQYKYFIVQEPGRGEGAAPTLSIDRMRQAAQHFVGEHDYRNFCKPDIASVRSFVRKIHVFDIEPVDLTDRGSGAQVFALNIRGTAFLWHQVRYMAAVLLMVGRGRESPDIVKRLLDLEAFPCKPQYTMASEEPLLLYACGFESLRFRRTEKAVEATQHVLSAALQRHLVAAALASAISTRLHADEKVIVPGEKCGHTASHMQLHKRAREPSLEDRAKKLGMTWPPPSQGDDEAME